MLHHIAVSTMEYCLLGQSRSGVGVEVGVDIFMPESDSESLKVRRLRSPGHKTLLHYFHTTSLFDLTVALTCILREPLTYGTLVVTSVALWQSLGSQLSLVWSWRPIRRKESALSFDPTLTRHLTF